MNKENEFKEINSSLVANFALKAKILGVLFSIVFCFQILAITFFIVKTNYIGTVIPFRIAILGPMMLFIGIVSEFLTFRYLKKLRGKEEQIKLNFVYLVTFIEISFPALLMMIIGTTLKQNDLYPPILILNSPLFVIFFIMIILSSLLLNFRICLFSGVIGGIEYLLLNIYFLSQLDTVTGIDCMNVAAKSVLIAVTGLLAGFVSKTIKAAVVSSMESKNELIFNLDKRVAEKTIEIENKNKLLEEKQKEIIDSIHYARRIQRTLLASETLLKNNLNEFFVLYKPKDIVSGDFYWATKNENGFYLAVCDCTGHGVPGAFMSLLNISFLNEAISEKKIKEPNAIFDQVRQRLIENISQDGGRDGMDGTLLHLNKNKITYSSAQNRPVLIRKNIVQILASDKMPVGKGEKIASFNLHSVDGEKGDMLYFFTDGYADQFGGPKGKKFKYKQLEQVFLSVHNLPMAEQKDVLEKKFNEWRGKLEQVDDVLIIGIKI